MKYSPSSRDALDAHCREVIRSCLNIVEQHGDTYVAIHKDDEIDCVVLVSMIRSYPIMSIIVADIDRFPILILLAFEPLIRRGMLPLLLMEPASAWPWQKWSKRSWLSAVSVIVGAVLP